MRFFIFFFVISIVEGATSNSLEQCRAFSYGKKFMFGLIGFDNIYTGLYLHVDITPTEAVQARVRITAPFINHDKTILVLNFTIVDLNATQIQFENGTQFKGIEISSDENISVHVSTSFGSDKIEGFLALPLTALGSRYIASSYTPLSSFSSEILVAGVDSDTDVSISTVIDGQTGSNKTFRLQKFESFQFKSVHDISGSVVTSNKPVAVISGSAYAMIPVGIGHYQYIIEQMIPTKYWTTKFVIPPIYPRKYFFLRFYADQDKTEIQYYNSTKHYAVYLSKGSMEEILFDTDPVVVIANRPISVIQYGHDGDNMAGDPYMSTAQGLAQYENSYKFVSQKKYSSADTLAITIARNNVSGLLLNGFHMSHYSVRNLTVSSPMDQYITLFINISYNTYYHLHHSGGLKFGAVIYGRYATTVGYGNPLQMSFISNECTGNNHVTTTDEPIATAPPSFSTQTTHSGKGNWCFKCDGMAHLKYCDKVSRCRDENEVCFVQSYTRSLDVLLYRSGCMLPKQCNVADGNSGCTKCCDGNFCNTFGCGDDGLPAPGQRGPLCFDCTHIGEGEECNTVQLCKTNQVCMIEKYEWGVNDSHYIRACTDSQLCSKKRSTGVLAARHAPVCSYCCHSDFCNDNCTSVNAVSEIIG